MDDKERSRVQDQAFITVGSRVVYLQNSSTAVYAQIGFFWMVNGATGMQDRMGRFIGILEVCQEDNPHVVQK